MQWLARGEPSVPAGDAWLTSVEAARAARMRFTKRRTEYLLRRYAGKCAVAEVVGLSEQPADLARIGVMNAPTGAPYVQVDGARIPMDVSLTDRAGWAVCLIGADLGAVGVDLEIVEQRSDGFVRDFLTSAEQEVVRSSPDRDAHDAAANLIWSAKESALKVLRTGLRADTRTVEIELADPGSVASGSAGTWQQLTAHTVLGELPGWWRRDGLFLLTVVTGSAVSRGVEPPSMLPGSANLSSATRIETWRARPLAD